jgi:hypothetical protein
MSVKAQLMDIQCKTAHKPLNKLVQDETKTLQQLNPSLRWFLSSITLHWQPASEHPSRLLAIKVILQTEDAGISTWAVSAIPAAILLALTQARRRIRLGGYRIVEG